MKKFCLVLLIAVNLLNSCTIVQEFHFNKDFSGHSKITIDMETLMQMMGGMDTTGASNQSMRDSLNFVFTESSQKLQETGVKNLQFGWVDSSNIIFMSYEFDNIESLNRALNASNTQNASLSKSIPAEPHTFFTLKGKTLIYNGIKSDKDISKANSEMESMNEYYQYSLIFNFERKVRKATNPNVKVSPDRKRVELSGSMFKIIRPDYDSNIKFKLK